MIPRWRRNQVVDVQSSSRHPTTPIKQSKRLGSKCRNLSSWTNLTAHYPALHQTPDLHRHDAASETIAATRTRKKQKGSRMLSRPRWHPTFPENVLSSIGNITQNDPLETQAGPKATKQSKIRKWDGISSGSSRIFVQRMSCISPATTLHSSRRKRNVLLRCFRDKDEVTAMITKFARCCAVFAPCPPTTTTHLHYNIVLYLTPWIHPTSKNTSSS